MFRETTIEWRPGFGVDQLVRPAKPQPPRPAPREDAEPPLSQETIRDYLAALGVDNVDPTIGRIDSWSSLQAFVATRVEAKSDTPPNNNTRLRVYGLESSHVVTMFIRHVIS